MPSPLIRTVRRWFAQIEAGEFDAFLAEIPADAVWEPSGSRTPLVGPAEVRGYLERQEPGERAEAHVYGFEQIGSCVLASGSLRMASGGELVEQQLTWLYVFDGAGRLRRAQHFPSAAEARAAAAAEASASLSEPGPAAGPPPAPGPPASSP